MEVKGVVSTFMATVDVIRQAIDLGANFIITHEPTWFSGADDTEWLSDDPVYLEKKKLIKEHQIAIWRFHDHMHMDVDDGIYRGFDEELDWGKYRVNVTVTLDGLEQFMSFRKQPWRSWHIFSRKSWI